LSQIYHVVGHGFISSPVSRNELVCFQEYGEDLYGAAFNCVTDRETPAQNPETSGLPPGVMAGDMPGVANVNKPFCSSGSDPRLSAAAIEGLNTRGPIQDVWTAGSTVEMCWNVQAAHAGVYSYRLCCDGTDSEECFQSNVMHTTDGSVWLPAPDSHFTLDYCNNMTVPEGLGGECTVSWRWDGGSESSVFVSCADVKIVSSPTPQRRRRRAPSPSPSGGCGYTACSDDQVCCCSGKQSYGYCVPKGSDSAVCAGSTMCPTKDECCSSVLPLAWI